MKWIKNTLGREIPLCLDSKPYRPFQGAFVDITQDQSDRSRKGRALRLRAIPKRQKPDKLVASWDELFERLDIKDGATISFHHHLRNGDRIVNQVIALLASRGVRELTLAPSALFAVHDALLPYIKEGVITKIEGSMNGAIGASCSHGEIAKTCILRSHGGRQRAIQDGDLPIDVAFIAAPCADPFGNANGLYGSSACGPLGYAKPDSEYARQVVVITDNLVSYPCSPWSIKGGNVDYVLNIDSIGDSSRIVSGTTQLTRSPTQLVIARLAARFIESTGLMKDGFSFQAGAGGISLAATAFLAERMRVAGVKASFAHGGATKVLVDLLEGGLLGSIIDLQCFDLDAVHSCVNNERHIESDPYSSYGPHANGCVANMLDIAMLGATEIDLNFNVNVVTHSDGMLLHGIGGHSDASSSAGCTIITAPSFRKRIPIIKEEVTTITCPGEVIDVLITERGIAINPLRDDLLWSAKRADLPCIDISQLMWEVHQITGVPEKPRFIDRPVALVEWRDGSIIDTVWQIEE